MDIFQWDKYAEFDYLGKIGQDDGDSLTTVWARCCLQSITSSPNLMNPDSSNFCKIFGNRFFPFFFPSLSHSPLFFFSIPFFSFFLSFSSFSSLLGFDSPNIQNIQSWQQILQVNGPLDLRFFSIISSPQVCSCHSRCGHNWFQGQGLPEFKLDENMDLKIQMMKKDETVFGKEL